MPGRDHRRRSMPRHHHAAHRMVRGHQDADPLRRQSLRGSRLHHGRRDGSVRNRRYRTRHRRLRNAVEVTLRALTSCLLALACGGNARGDDATPVEASAEARERIAAALDRDHSPWAATVRAAETTVTRVASPSWLNGTVWRVERFMPTRPLVFYVGDGKG